MTAAQTAKDPVPPAHASGSRDAPDIRHPPSAASAEVREP